MKVVLARTRDFFSHPVAIFGKKGRGSNQESGLWPSSSTWQVKALFTLDFVNIFGVCASAYTERIHRSPCTQRMSKVYPSAGLYLSVLEGNLYFTMEVNSRHISLYTFTVGKVKHFHRSFTSTYTILTRPFYTGQCSGKNFGRNVRSAVSR